MTGTMPGPRTSLRLYVAADGPNSVAARANLRAALARCREGGAEVDVEIIDVIEEPERGLIDGVLVTPTLVRLAPLPQRRVVGNLRDEDVLMAALGRTGDEK